MLPGAREDGWMEIEVGHFVSCDGDHDDDDDGDQEVMMSLMEIKVASFEGWTYC